MDVFKYDDLFSDIFLDDLFLWFKTSKVNEGHRRPRVPSNKILDIVRRNILDNNKPDDAVKELLKMDYFRHYLAAKATEERREFVEHMKRYLYMYMPDAGYEVSDTRRYKRGNKRVEPCLVATKDWHVGEELRFCTGMIACLDAKLADALQLRREKQDDSDEFSLMYSMHKTCSCLFLGPIRFVNHDCDSNCKFVSLGQNTVSLKVIKEIKCGEELTAFYGNHYFPKELFDCPCATCERRSYGHSFRKRKLTLRDGDERPKKRQTVKRPLPDLERILNLTDTWHSKRQNSSVMSIDFLCGASEKKEEEKSPLNLLCEAVEKVNNTLTIFMDRGSSSSSLGGLTDDDGSKADSAVAVSPTLTVKHEADDRRSDLDDLIDNVSELSSVASSEVESWWSDNDQDVLTCIACSRVLRQEEISEQVGCDTSIAAELATWTWKPSAFFKDWRLKRCPRCERHRAIFAQEWPERKPIRLLTCQAKSSSTRKRRRRAPKRQNKRKELATTTKTNERDDDSLFESDWYTSPLTPLSDFCGDEAELLS